VIAIKRAQKESMQGKLEFKAEIELLSRVHHKNLVSLLGFCFDQGEQMLVYEYLQNGSLKDALTGILILLHTKHVNLLNICPIIIMSFACSVLYHYI